MHSLNSLSRLLSLLPIFILLIGIQCKKDYKGEKPKWAQKDLRDYSDADLERLLDQWEEDEEPLEEDELPEHLRKPVPFDFSGIDPSNPEALMRLSKKGKTLMAFVAVTDNPAKEELEDITKLWQSSLMNNHIQSDRYLIDEHRAIFMFKDGSQAWDAKDYLIDQVRCKEVVIENKTYQGKHAKISKDPTQSATSAKTKNEL